jgi:hypothetical protein
MKRKTVFSFQNLTLKPASKHIIKPWLSAFELADSFQEDLNKHNIGIYGSLAAKSPCVMLEPHAMRGWHDGTSNLSPIPEFQTGSLFLRKVHWPRMSSGVMAISLRSECGNGPRQQFKFSVILQAWVFWGWVLARVYAAASQSTNTRLSLDLGDFFLFPGPQFRQKPKISVWKQGFCIAGQRQLLVHCSNPNCLQDSCLCCCTEGYNVAQDIPKQFNIIGAES